MIRVLSLLWVMTAAAPLIDKTYDHGAVCIVCLRRDFNPFGVFLETLRLHEVDPVFCLVPSTFLLVVFKFHYGIEYIPL